MITGELKSQIDQIWNTFWTGGISNTITIVEQLTYLIFIKDLDETETRNERMAKRLNKDFTPIFGEEEGMQSIYTQAVEYGEIAQTDFNASFSIFQSYIDKAFDVRLCIFGDRIHAFKISTQENDLSQVDSRGFSPALLPHEEITLPEEIADKVASMMSNMGLVFSAMDFVVDRAGEWWFLENNCNGQWLWLQHVTGVDLVGGFVDLLLEKCETV